MDTNTTAIKQISNNQRKRQVAAAHNARIEAHGYEAVAASGLIVPMGMTNRASRNAAAFKGKTKRSRPLRPQSGRNADMAERGLSKIERLLARA